MPAKTVSVCHVNLARGFRGGERQTELLIRGLAEWGMQQRFVGRKNEPLLKRLADVPKLELRPCAGNALAAKWGTKGAALVHAHEARAAHAAYLRHRSSGTPYVVTKRVDNVPKNSRFSHKVFAKAARLVVLSRAIKTVMSDYDPQLECSIIPDASGKLIQHVAATRRIREKYAGKFLIGHAGALDHSHKGQGILIETARQLQRTHPDIHFLLLGAGKDEAEFRTAAKQLKNLELMGHVDNIGDYLAALDLFAFPSLREGMGSVLLDVMSFGVPIVASKVGGIPDIVKPEVNGLLVAPGSSDQLEYAILRLYKDRELCQRMGEQGAAGVEDYSPERMTERYLELYQPLLGEFSFAAENG